MRKTVKRLFSLALCLLVCGLLPVSALAEEPEAAGEEREYRLTVSLRTAEDVLDLVHSCSLDAWSRDVLVVLENDISLAGTDFTPIPSFSGTLDGQGHTISGVSVSGSLSPAGLFARVLPDGEIRDLNVEGDIVPQGDGSSTGGIAGLNGGRILRCRFTGSVSAKALAGGIAGQNTASGVIQDCRVRGGVFGQSMTGGIAGENLGTVTGCANESYVNIVSSDPQLLLDDLKINDLTDVLTLASADTINLTSDTGGIVGHNLGTVENCSNSGTVGYPHVGYNAGGIAGRSSGYITGCTNTGLLFGRKDVGGIVGQSEPYVEVSVSEDLLQKLSGQMGGLNGLINSAIRHTDQTMGTLSEQFISMAGYLKPLRDALDSVDFTDMDSVRSVMSQVSAAMGALQSQLVAISGQVTETSDTLSQDFRAINNQISAISGTTIGAMDAISGTSVSDLITDASGVDIDAITSGKIFDCRNEAEIRGDINVGGITGAMSIESVVDPEDELHRSVSSTVRQEYKLRSIVQQCTNTGAVVSKKDCAGGICGREELGMIYQSVSLGPVESESGQYVGGVAGLGYSTVRACWSKCSLAGDRYVGGILGSGDTDSVTGISSEVVDCVSMVEVTRCRQFSGAVSGYETGSFSNNRFVSDTLAGVNALSYQGLAEPISYEELLALEGLPDAFRTLTLSFRADGQELKSLVFSYGRSFGAWVYPDIPEKEGYYGVWDKTELKELRFDTTVNVVYCPRITSLPTETLRFERPLFFVEGRFRDGDRLTALLGDPAEESLEPFAETVNDKLRSLLRGVRPDPYIPEAVSDRWTLEIPDDGESVHTVRLRAPDEKAGTYRLYLRSGDEWVLTDYRLIGQYLCFEASGGVVEGLVVSTIRTGWILLWAAGAAVVLAVLVLVLVKLIRCRKKRRADMPKKEKTPLTPAEKKKRRRITAAVIAAVVILAVGGAFLLRYTSLRADVEVYARLKSLLAVEHLDMDAQLSLDWDGRASEKEMTVCRTKLDDGAVTRFTYDGIPVYGCNGVFYLQNGKAFVLDNGAPSPDAFPEAIALLFRSSRAEAETRDGDTLYRITIPTEKAAGALSFIEPFAALSWEDDQSVTLELLCRDEAVKEIRLTADAVLDEKPLHVQGVIQTRVSEEAHPAPEAVINAIRAAEAAPNRILTEDVLRLFSALRTLEKQTYQRAAIRLYADCGSLLVDESFGYARGEVHDTPVRSIQAGSFTVYLTENAIYNADGKRLTALPAPAARLPGLWDTVKELIQTGDFTCETQENRAVYTMALDADGMMTAARAVSPRIDDLNVNLRSGTLRAVVEDGSFTELTIQCTGTVRIVLADVDVVFNLQITPESVSYVRIPKAVRDAVIADEY